MNTVRFCGYDCDVRKIQYPNQQLALELVASDTKNNSQQGIIPGEPVCVATVCLPDFKFKPNQSAIRDYSELAGILDVLEEAKIVKRTGQQLPTGYVSVPVVNVLI
jgi:hypothetical protein